MKKSIILNESHFYNNRFKTKESRIIKESCDEFILENGRITHKQLFDVISVASTQLYLKGYSNSRINEGIRQTIEEGFFSDGASGLWQTIKEKAVKWLLGKLGIGGNLKDYLAVSLANIPLSDYKLFLSPVQNCEKIADHLADGLIEWLAEEGMQKLDVGQGWVGQIIRNTIGEMFLDEGFIQDLQDKFIPVICGKLNQAVT
jgi:hypothetical protein